MNFLTRHRRLLTGLVVGLLAAPALVWAQAPAAALRQRLATALPDTTRLRLLEAFCRAAGPETDLRPYARQGAALAQKLGRRPQQASYLFVLAQTAAQRQDLVAATGYAQQIVRLTTRPPVEALLTARAYVLLSSLALMREDYAAARAPIALAIGWGRRAPASPERLRILASAYATLGDALVIPLTNAGGHPAIPDSVVRQARAAIAQTQRLARQLQAGGDRQSYIGHLANAANNAGNLDLALGRYAAARACKRRAVSLFDSLGSPPNATYCRQNLAEIELAGGYYAAAAATARTAAAAAHRYQMPLVEADSYQVLANALDSLGRSREALRVLRRATTVRDTLLRAANAEAIARLQTGFDAERQQARIRQLTLQRRTQQALAGQQRVRIGGLGLGVGLLLTGLAVGLVLFVRLRRQRAQLAALALTKDRLYALVAHDLRGPVQALGGLGGLIDHYLLRADLDALGRLPPLVAQAVDGIHQLLDNLLHWAASQTGELGYHPVPQPTAPALLEAVALWHTTAQANQIAVVVRPCAPAAAFLADPQMLRTVLRNLVGNALKFTPTGGTVTLETFATACGGYRLTVADTGPGLSPADVALLLGPAVGPSTLRRDGARGEQGTGLGLRLCQLFMRRHGGTLALRSAPGQGTTAEVWFPAGS